MRRLRAFTIRLKGLFTGSKREREIEDELASHIDLHIDDNLRAGMSPEEARRHALVKLGGMESVKDAWRERSSTPFAEHLVLDLRFTLRQLRKNPGFASTAIAVLSLGIAACIAIFAFVDAALIQPVPYPDSAALVAVTESVPLFPRANLSWLDYRDWKQLNTVFRTLEVFRGEGFLYPSPGGAVPVDAARVSVGFFRALGVAPAFGRDFEDADHSSAVILSYAAWQRRFSRRKDLVGRPVELSGQAYTIVGILPADFHFAPLGAAEFWVPVDPSASCEARRSCHNLNGIARLLPGVSVQSALANLATIASQLERQYPDSNRGQGASVEPISAMLNGGLQPVLLTLMGGAALLLLIACVNVAGLVLVRSESRRREFAVRTALGASISRQWGQFITEALLLALISSAMGLLLARFAIRVLVAVVPAEMVDRMPFLLGLGLNTHTLICVAFVTLISATLFAFIPALQLSPSKIREGLPEGSRGSSGNTWRRLGGRMVVVELAVAMVLLAGAALFGESLYRLLRVNVGFAPDQLATVRISAPRIRYNNDPKRIALARKILPRLQEVPGVESAAIVNLLPLSYNGNTDWIRIVGKPYDGKHIDVNERDVSSEYFRTIGAALRGGRYFRDDEDQSKPRVVIVNETLAKKYFPGENPVGQQIGDIKLTPSSLWTIIGVVADIREGSLDSQIYPAEYHPYLQDPDGVFAAVARTSQKPEAILAAMSAAIHRVDPNLGVSGEAAMRTRMDNSATAYLHRSAAWLTSGFAALALLLSVVGLYGVVAYSVSRRTREIGVRIALGALRSSVYRLILKEAGLLVALGIGLGAAGAVSAAVLAHDLLFGVESWDFATLTAVAAILGASAIVAAAAAARRAASVNPREALRAE